MDGRIASLSASPSYTFTKTTAERVRVLQGLGVEGLSITGPGLPVLRGLVLRVAVLAVDPALATWGASQPEEIVLQ